MKQHFSFLDGLKATLDQHRPLDPAIVRNLREDLILRWTYHSNAIEGNTLTLRETKVALEGITEPFVQMIAGIVRDSFKPYWHALGLPWEEAQ